MADIYLHGRQIESIFELLGDKENDITYSIGWAFANSPAFLDAFIKKVLPKASTIDEAVVLLQDSKRGSGRTDIEIRGGTFHIIIEAKRGWSLPNDRQLNLYATRLKRDNDQQNIIVAMSECSQEYSSLHLPKNIQDVPVKIFSWKDIASLTKTVKNASYTEKWLLEQLRIYLRRIVNMQKQESNMVYVVSLSSEKPGNSTLSYLDIVKKKKLYFHPVGPKNGWPSAPHNYIGFRYDGKLQSIHHIESWKIIDDVHASIPEIDSRGWGPHFLYSLGPAIIPEKEVRTGNIFRSGRKKVMLDLLLTSSTIYEAAILTKKRLTKDN